MYVTCQYCARSISKYNLNRHYSSKKCIKKREEKEKEREENEKEEEKKRKEKYKCLDCNKIFTSKRNLENHYSNCLDFQISLGKKDLQLQIQLKEQHYITELKLKDQEIQFLKENLRIAEDKSEENLRNAEDRDRISDLEKLLYEKNKADQDTLHEIAKRPTTQKIKKTNIVLAPYSDPALIIEEKYVMRYIVQGVKGVAQCVFDNNKDENGNCRHRRGDPSRGTIYSNDINNVEIADPKATNLIRQIKDPVRKKSNELCAQLIGEMSEEMCTNVLEAGNLEQHNTKFAMELCSLLPK